VDFRRVFTITLRKLRCRYSISRIRQPKAKGVEPTIFKWIDHWLTDRKQKVSIKGETSERGNVKSVVPQGTVLGSCLFTMFTDDLESESDLLQLEVFIIKFADGTKDRKKLEIRKTEKKSKQCWTHCGNGQRNGKWSSTWKSVRLCI
jgi:hypothetical protein